MVNIKEKISKIIKNPAFLIGAASFLLPLVMLGIIFICGGIHPVGDRQILVTDLWHQYYPFLCELQEKLKAGESLLFSKSIGLGVNFLALIAYYCASPLNILIMLVSKEALRGMLVVIVLLKVGFGGFFMSRYLRKISGRYDYSTVVFSALYALCGYVLGYYWNIMWLDCVVLLPLVMLGVHCLIKEKKVILYIASLAVAVISNFYIGFMLCIFTAIYFFAECFMQSLDWKTFFKRFVLIGVATVVCLAMTAFITIPTYNALNNTISVESEEEKEMTFADKFGEFFKDAAKNIREEGADIIGRTVTFNQPVPKDGLPNMFSGMISVIFLGLFFACKNIKGKEKGAFGAMLIIMLLSIMIEDIDIIWHGFHKPNMVPYRYAFIFSFVMIVMAYKTYIALFCNENTIKNFRKDDNAVGIGVSIAITALCILSAAANADTHIATVIGAMAISVLFYYTIFSFGSERNQKKKESLRRALCVLIGIELLINAIIAVPTVRLTKYSTYYSYGEEVEKLLEDIDEKNQFSRVEISRDYILNDPALYGYKGVSVFSSTANANVSKFMEKIAICGRPGSNRYYYQTTSPLTNAFLGVEHVIFKSGNNMKNLNPYLESVSDVLNEKGEVRAWITKNTQALPLGFMTESELLAEEGLVGENPFEIQNDLFRKATGLKDDLFTPMKITSVPSTNTVTFSAPSSNKGTITLVEGATEKKLQMKYTAPDNNCIFAYLNCRKIDYVHVSKSKYEAERSAYIFPVGKYEEGENIIFDFDVNKDFKGKANCEIQVYSMDERLFEEGMELLRDEPLKLETYDSTLIEGDVEVKEDGVLYTSFTYEEGWKAYVDGKETEIKPLENAMIAIPLTKGSHSIVLKYSPAGFSAGCVISLVGLLMFIGIIAGYIIISKRRKDNNG